MDALQQLQAFAARFNALPDDELPLLATYMQEASYEPGQLLIETGAVPPYAGFLMEGVCRTFFYDEDGNERTRRIALGPTIVGEHHAFMAQQPSSVSLDFLQPSRVLCVSHANYLALRESSPAFSAFMDAALAHELKAIQNYMQGFLSLTAKERYLRLLNNLPGLAQAVPLHYIASWLGITPVQLSRIRKELAQEGR